MRLVLACGQPAAASRACGAASSSARQRRGAQQRRGSALLARAFDEGAAQVRRLVDRDRKELDLDELEATFAEDAVPGAAAPSTPASAAEADGSVVRPPPVAAAAAAGAARSPFQAVPSAADKTPVNPFGPAASSAAAAASSPFASGAAASKRPFAEPAGLSPNMPTPKQDAAPWWTRITLTQVVIVLSFTTIIGLMVSTFFFVLGTGAIHFND